MTGCSSSIGRYSGSKGRSAYGKPGTVSLEKLTSRRAPPAIAASSTLNVLSMLLAKTTCGALWIGCGIAAVCTTTSMPAATA